MRSVRPERKSARTRGKSGRTPSRGVSRGQSTQPRRGKSSGTLFSRAWSAIAGLVDFSHPILVLGVGVVVLAGFAAVIAGGVVDRTVKKTDTAAGAFAAGAGFGIAQVHLSGNVRTRPEEIMTAMGLRAGQSIFSVDLRAARSRLLQLPWVANAEVKRRFPDDISVQIVERTPYARWQTPKEMFVVERRGHVIVADRSDAYDRLPLLIGNGAPEQADGFVEAVARHRAIVARVEAYQYQSRRRWNLLLDDGVVVKLPETGWDKQLQVLEHLIVDKGILESDIREIDLRHPTHIFFVRRNGQEQKERKPETGSAI